MSRSPELMNPGDTLLCIVDLQERLLPVVQRPSLIGWNVRRLAEGAKILGVPTVASEQYPEKLGPTIEPIAGLLSGSAASKLRFSCADCQGLFAPPEDSGRHRVLLCGIETHVCVQQSAYDLMAAGFQVYLAADATGTRHAVDYELALRRMESAGVIVTTTEAALFEWCREAGTPQFKQISQLAKETPPEDPSRG